ncbi:hypothetical protein H7F33_03275 [Pedobacter sp. PAMC26386]|nr:hypothetical protein H7F33_03275 [Pedobacter sp. PAMC26386]
MKTQTITTKRAAQDVGQRINEELADYLKNEFKQQFPAEKLVVFLTRETIMKSFDHLGDVSGIRFMYGLEKAGDSRSRVLLLIPCNTTSTNLNIPNIIVDPKGYINDRGTQVNLEKSWEILYNHTAHFTSYYPEHNYRKIMRGTFIGIRSLLSMLEIDGCEGINFHFGYDNTVSDISEKNRPVFEAVNSWGDGLDLFDFTSPCPVYCDIETLNGSQNQSEKHTNLNGLVLNPHFRDEYLLKYKEMGPLVEMFYSVGPAIDERIIASKSNSKTEVNPCQVQIKALDKLVNAGKYEEAKDVFEVIVKDMMDTYLFQ